MRNPFHRIAPVATTKSRKLGVTIPANKPQVFDSIIVVHTVNMIQDQYQRFFLPYRRHIAYGTGVRDHSFRYQSLLEATPIVGGIFHEDRFKGEPFIPKGMSANLQPLVPDLTPFLGASQWGFDPFDLVRVVGARSLVSRAPSRVFELSVTVLAVHHVVAS